MLTMTVNDPDKIIMMMIIKAVQEKTGIERLYGLRKNVILTMNYQKKMRPTVTS